MLGGIITGTLLGAVGSLLSFESRLAFASVLSVVAIIFGSLEISGRRIRPLQCDRETPKHWLDAGPFSWAIINGMALGCGATSRIGFWIWYIVPISALLSGRPELGAIIYGTYATIRGLAIWAIIFVIHRWQNFDPTEWLIQHKNAVRIVAASQLTFLGIVVAIAIGL